MRQSIRLFLVEKGEGRRSGGAGPTPQTEEGKRRSVEDYELLRHQRVKRRWILESQGKDGEICIPRTAGRQAWEGYSSRQVTAVPLVREE